MMEFWLDVLSQSPTVVVMIYAFYEIRKILTGQIKALQQALERQSERHRQDIRQERENCRQHLQEVLMAYKNGH